MARISPLSTAESLQAQRKMVTDKATVRALRLFRTIHPDRLDAGWDRVAPQLVSVVTAAQVAAARQSGPYLDKVAAYYGGAPAAEVVAEAFGGVMLDGREVGPAMFGAVTGTKTLVGKGMQSSRAFEVGASFLATIVGAAVQDMGRQSDITLATGRKYTRYVRVVSAGACSRCAIMAGVGDFRRPFERHPRCKCTSWPVERDATPPEGFFDTPTDYFESLSPAEQERVFTKAGAFAIRNGADPSKVVNARRGALTGGELGAPARLVKTRIGIRADGSPLEVYLTAEGTTLRAAYGRSEMERLSGAGFYKGETDRYRRTKAPRLMPEQIQVMAGSDPDRAVKLLKRYGYLY